MRGSFFTTKCTKVSTRITKTSKYKDLTAKFFVKCVLVFFYHRVHEVSTRITKTNRYGDLL